LQIDGFASVDPEAAKAFAAFNEKLSASGIELYTWDKSPLIAAAEDAIHDAAALSRKINAWESRWPLNTYARDLGSEGLSKTMRDRLCEAEAMTLENYQELLSDRSRGRLHNAIRVRASAGGIASTGDPTFAIPGSLLGVPALSLPLFTVSGLPVGLQALGFRDADATLFELAPACRRFPDRDRPQVN
jgi:Asp-tRNA(Asn)/Glu-tRNA(Gln) amidotransferase A subunit family amidase